MRATTLMANERPLEVNASQRAVGDERRKDLHLRFEVRSRCSDQTGHKAGYPGSLMMSSGPPRTFAVVAKLSAECTVAVNVDQATGRSRGPARHVLDRHRPVGHHQLPLTHPI